MCKNSYQYNGNSILKFMLAYIYISYGLTRNIYIYSLGPIEGQSVQKYTPHNRTTQRRYTPRDSSRQLRHFGKSIPEFEETNSSVLGYDMRLVSASIMSRSCFASFPVCVYKFSSHYLNNIIFYRQ